MQPGFSCIKRYASPKFKMDTEDHVLNGDYTTG